MDVKIDNNYVLGIDTSNYKTSIAIVDRFGTVVLDERILLRVKAGERGLRQSEALFQHVENLPVLFEAVEKCNVKLSAVSVSTRPRNVDGSYMPCFKGGYGFGKAIAHSMNIPCFEFSHQEGHLEAIKYFSKFKNYENLLAWHLSGGTCELLKVQLCSQTEDIKNIGKESYKIEIIGGSKDISFGQVLDRVGVNMGLSFPSGSEMDKKAVQYKQNCIDEKYEKQLTTIKLNDLYFNLSGIETQSNRLVNLLNEVKKESIETEDIELIRKNSKEQQENALIREIFDKISQCIINVTEEAAKKLKVNKIVFAGGVSGSQYIRRQIENAFINSNIDVDFGRQELSSDNAVGIALLGGKSLWP